MASKKKKSTKPYNKISESERKAIKGAFKEGYRSENWLKTEAKKKEAAKKINSVLTPNGRQEGTYSRDFRTVKPGTTSNRITSGGRQEGTYNKEARKAEPGKRPENPATRNNTENKPTENGPAGSSWQDRFTWFNQGNNRQGTSWQQNVVNFAQSRKNGSSSSGTGTKAAEETRRGPSQPDYSRAEKKGTSAIAGTVNAQWPGIRENQTREREKERRTHEIGHEIMQAGMKNYSGRNALQERKPDMEAVRGQGMEISEALKGYDAGGETKPQGLFDFQKQRGITTGAANMLQGMQQQAAQSATVQPRRFGDGSYRDFVSGVMGADRDRIAAGFDAQKANEELRALREQARSIAPEAGTGKVPIQPGYFYNQVKNYGTANRYNEAIRAMNLGYDYQGWLQKAPEEATSALDYRNARRISDTIGEMQNRGMLGGDSDSRNTNKTRFGWSISPYGDLAKAKEENKKDSYFVDIKHMNRQQLGWAREKYETEAAAHQQKIDELEAKAGTVKKVNGGSLNAERLSGIIDDPTNEDKVNRAELAIMHDIEPYTQVNPINKMDDEFKELFAQDVYDFLNHDGAYEEKMNSLQTEEEKEAFRQRVYDSVFSTDEEAQENKNEIENEKSDLRYCQDRLQEIEWQENAWARYDDVNAKYAMEGDPVYHGAEMYGGYDEAVPDLKHHLTFDTAMKPTGFTFSKNDIHLYADLINGGEWGMNWAEEIDKQYPGFLAKQGILYLNQDEKARFNVYFNAGQYDEAWAYVQGLNNSGILNQRSRTFEAIENKNQSSKYPVTSTLETFEDTVMQPIEFGKRTWGEITGDPQVGDPYGKYYTRTRHKNDIRGYIASELPELASFFYQAGTSAADSYLNMKIARCFGAEGIGLLGTKGVGAISLGLFGMEAYQTSFQHNLEISGGDIAWSRTGAIIDTLIEEGTEIFSVEALMGDSENLFLYLAKNAVAEGSEELVGSAFGPYIRELFGRRNEWKQRADDIWRRGGWTDGQGVFHPVSSQKEALRQALREWNEDIKMSTLSGMASTGGGVFVGTGRNIQTNNQYRREGANIQNYREGQQSFVQNRQQQGQQAQEMMQNRQAEGEQQENAPVQHQAGLQEILQNVRNLKENVQNKDQQKQNKLVRQLAEQIQQKIENGVEPTKREIGKLSIKMQEALRQQRYEETRSAIFNQFKEEGMSEFKAKRAANLVAKAYASGQGINGLTVSERAELHLYGQAEAALKAMTGETQQNRTQQAQETTEAARNAGQNAAEAAQAQTEAAGNAVQTAQNAVREGAQAQEQSAEAAGNVVDTVQNAVQEGAEAEEQNAEAIRQAGEMAERLKTRIAEATQETEQAMRSIAQVTMQNNQAVNELREKGSAELQSTVGEQLASEEEINRTAETSQRVEGAREAIVDGQFMRVNNIREQTVRNEDGSQQRKLVFTVQDQNGNTHEVDPSQVKATDYATAAILRLATTDSGIFSPKYANTLLAMQDSGMVQNAGQFMQEALQLRMAAYLEEQIPAVSMPQEQAQMLYDASLEEHREARTAETGNRQNIKPGQGKAYLQGTEYGTKEFQQKMKDMGLSTQQRQQIHAVASFAQHSGIEVNFQTLQEIRDAYKAENGRELTEEEAQRVYGYQQGNRISLNIEGKRTDLMTGVKEQNHMVVTFGHEMTHWLQQNSEQGYNNLRSFVLNELRNNNGGKSLSSMVMKMIESRAAMGSNLTVEQAIDEIVADACDHIMASEEMANHLKETNQGLYNKVKSFVQALVAKIRNGIKGMKGMHYNNMSIAMMGRVNEMAKIWLGAYDEAISREYANAVIQQAEARPVSNFSMSAPIEYRADGLVAQHNLSVQSLIKCIQMGGLWAPSTAVHNVGMRWNDFGEISAYLPVQFVDPKADKRNHLHRGDAYTPILRGYNVSTEAEAMEAFRQQADRMYTRGTSLRGLITSFVRVNSLEEARQKALRPEQNNGRTELKSHWEAADKAEDALWAKINEAVQEQDSWAEEDDYVAAFTTGITLGHEAILEAGEIGREQARALMRREIENEIRSQRERGLMVTEVTANELSDKLIDNMIDYAKQVDDSYQRPMQEAKPYRMVKFSELSALKIPNTLSEEIRQQLEDLGLSRDRMIEYDPKKKNGEVGSSQWADEMIPLTKQGVMFSMGEDMSVEHQNRVLEESGELTNAPAAYSLAGISAQGGYAEQVKRAMQMAKEGYDEDQIQSETGCVKGWKGRWWKLLDNGKMNLKWNPDSLIEGAQYKLQAIYDAEELYKAYPQMDGVWVKIESMDGALGAQANGIIILTPELISRGKEAIEATLQHEIQHVIQYYEGSNRGSNPVFWRDMQQIGRARLVTNEKEQTEIFNKYGIDMEKDLRFGLEFNDEGEINYEYLTQDWGVSQETRKKIDNIDQFDLGRLQMIQEDMDKWMKLLRGAPSPVELYYNTVGEIEARASSRTGIDQYEPINYHDAVAVEDYARREASYSMDAQETEYYNRIDQASQNARELNAQLKELTNGAEYNDFVERMHNAKTSEERKAVHDEILEWEKKNDIKGLKERAYAAEQERKAAQKELDEYVENRDVAAEQKKIKESGLEEPEYRREQAKKEFGFTTDFREAGYMLPNGKMLNFSGEKGRHTGMRGEDHRGIGRIYASNKMQGGNAMMAFMNDGNIRVMAETPGIDISIKQEPTSEQYNMIRSMARRFASGEYFNVDFTNENGYNEDSIEYDGNVRPDRIVNDIKNFFKNGVARQQSVVSQFHTSYSMEPGTEIKAEDGRDMGTVLTGGTVALGTQYSLASFPEKEQNRVRDWLIKSKRFSEKQINKYMKDATSIASIIMGDMQRLDYVADRGKKMLKPNAEYVKTLDASTLCAKRLLYQGTFNAIQHALPNSVLMPEDLVDLSNLLREMGYETPCGICYVESRRRLTGKFTEDWLKEYNGKYIPRIEEVTTTDGLEKLRQKHPETYNDFVKAMNKKGVVNPKIVQLQTDYRGEIRRMGHKQIQKIKNIGGLRVQSFSDFETPHLLDMTQAIMDMAAKNLTAQAYTKVPDFAWVFGDTGMKINLSLIGKGKGIDAQGRLIFDDVEGMPAEEAFRARERYSKNVGTILVGINDAHILAAMADPRIDFIIPFHKSGWSAAELHRMPVLESYDDYTDYQNEKVIVGRNEDGSYKLDSLANHKLSNFQPVGENGYWDFNLSGKENAENYLRMCAEEGRIPKFWQFLVDNGDGSFSLQPDGSTDGYWKTLIDFKMYDNNGVGSPQTEIVPNINMEEATRVLNEYSLDRNGVHRESNNDLPVAQDAVDRYVKEYKAKHPRASYSMDAEHMDVNNWMMGLTPGSLQTEDERQLLEAYKGLRISISLSIKRQMDYNQELKKLQQKAELTEEDREQIRALNNKLEVQKQKQERLESKLFDITDSAGFAGMMHRQNRVLQDFVHGKTQQQVTEAVNNMDSEAKALRSEIAKLRTEAEELAASEAVQAVKSHMSKTSLAFASKALRKEYMTQMGKAEMESRLAEMALRNAQGESIIDEAMQMARDMANNVRGLENETLERLRGMVIELGPGQLAEIKGKNMTLNDLKQQLKGTGITIKTSKSGLSTLENNSDELHELYPDMPDLGGEKDQIFNFIDWVKGMQQATAGENVYGYDLEDLTIKIMAMAGNITADITNDPAAKKIIDRLMAGIEQMSGKTQQMAERMAQLEERLDNIEFAGTKAKGWASVLQRDVTTAIDYYNKIAKIAAQEARERVKTGLIETLRSENTAKLIKQQQEYEGKIKDMKKANVLKADNEQLRRQIDTSVKRVYRWMANETDLRNIPEQVKPMARALVQMLVKGDLTEGNRRVMFNEKKDLQRARETLDAWDRMDGPVDMESALSFLVERDSEGREDTTIRDQVWEDFVKIESGLQLYRTAEGRGLISLQDRRIGLERVRDAIQEIYNVITSAQKVEINGRREIAEDVAYRARDDMQNSKYKGQWNSKVIRGINNAVRYGNLTPEYFFKNLKNKAMGLLHDNFKEAENRTGLEIRKAKTAIAQIAEETGYRNWDPNEMHELTLERGGKVKLSTEQLMSLWATWQREMRNQMQGENGPEKSYHLTEGGFYVPYKSESKNPLGREVIKQKAYRVTEEDMEQVKNMLTEEQHEYVDRIVSYLSNEMSTLGNEASMRMFGIKKFKEAYYFPFRIWEGVKNQRSDAGGSNIENRATHSSFSNRRTANARNAIELGDFSRTAAEHIAQMVNYATMGPAVEFMNRVLNQQLTETEGDNQTRRNVRTAFKEAYGHEALSYLQTWMKDVNGGIAQDPRKTIREKLLSVFKKNAVAGSFSVAAQQPLSYIRAAMMINPKYLAQAISPQYWKGSYQEMMENSGVAVIKNMGRFDMGYGETAAQYIMPEAKQGKIRGAMDWLGEKSTILPEKMDNMTWTRMWSAVKLEQHAQHPEMDMKSPEFMKLVAERFNDVMRKTQVYDSVMTKSANMRSTNFIMKSVTSFMAEPTLSLNVLADAMSNIKEKGGKATAAKAVATFLLSAAAQAAAKALFGAGRSPDKKKTKDENFMNKFLQNFLSEANPLNLIPGYSDMVELLGGNEITDDAYSVVAKAESIRKNLEKLFSGDGSTYRNLEDSVGQMLQLFSNVPVKNLMRDFRAMTTWFGGNEGSRWLTGNDAYAERENSPAVIKRQTLDMIHTTGMVGVINKWLGDAGYDTSNKGYYKRIAAATAAGQDEKAAEMTEYLTLGKGVKESTIEKEATSAGKGDLETRIKNGDTSAEEARAELKKLKPEKSDDDIWFEVDRIEYERETGRSVSGGAKYYRFDDAMETNRTEEIRTQVKSLKDHGVPIEKIRDHIHDQYRDSYLDASGQEKIRIRDMIIKAYKETGLSEEEANKKVNSWKRKE